MLAIVFVDEINESEKISKEISATLKNGIVGAMPCWFECFFAVATITCTIALGLLKQNNYRFTRTITVASLYQLNTLGGSIFKFRILSHIAA